MHLLLSRRLHTTASHATQCCLISPLLLMSLTHAYMVCCHSPAQVRMLADKVRRAAHFVVYTGAGISTASGIGDYASKGKQAAARQKMLKSIGKDGARLADKDINDGACLGLFCRASRAYVRRVRAC
jgi:hypothetical protein